MPENKQSNLIASVKTSNIGFYQQIYYQLRNKGIKGGLFSVS